MKSFLTGSQAYGEVKLTSDIDLVVRMSEKDARLIMAGSDKPPSEALIEHYGISGLHAIRYGLLNLLICTTEEHFSAWKIGTEMCIRRSKFFGRPLTRKEAVEIFSELFNNTLP